MATGDENQRFLFLERGDLFLSAADANEFRSVVRKYPCVSEAIDKVLAHEIVLIEQVNAPANNADKKASCASRRCLNRIQ